MWNDCSLDVVGVLAIAAELDTSPDQDAVAWAGSHGAVPIISPRTLEQLTSNLGAFALDISPGLVWV